MDKKKQRGQQRKLKRFISYLQKHTMLFPECDSRYVHYHMPCAQSFINSPKTSAKVKTRAMQCILDCTEHLYKIKPNNSGFCRVVCVLDYPNIWASQIIVFFDEKYFDDFFVRSNREQIWIAIHDKSFGKSRNLHSIPEFIEHGYLEKIYDEYNHLTYEGELWFYGELTI